MIHVSNTFFVRRKQLLCFLICIVDNVPRYVKYCWHYIWCITTQLAGNGIVTHLQRWLRAGGVFWCRDGTGPTHKDASGIQIPGIHLCDCLHFCLGRDTFVLVSMTVLCTRSSIIKVSLCKFLFWKLLMSYCRIMLRVTLEGTQGQCSYIQHQWWCQRVIGHLTTFTSDIGCTLHLSFGIPYT